jgi:enolase 1/2/3
LSQRSIAKVLAWQALDSRGNPTVGCTVWLAGGAEGTVTVPSGASTGKFEVHERRDGGPAYAGLGTEDAVRFVNTELAAAVIGIDAVDTAMVDAALAEVDGTPNLRRVGGNAVLAVSLATLLAAAISKSQPLWRFASQSSGQVPTLPLPMVNIVSGGAHAARRLDIQDVLAIPVGASSLRQAIEWSWLVRRSAQILAEQRGAPAGVVADEGGVAPIMPTNRSALELVIDAIDDCGLQAGRDVAIGVDVAANQLTDRAQTDGEARRYALALERRSLTSAELLDELAVWAHEYPLVSIEDPMADDDMSGWDLARSLPGQRLGDDLIATHADRVSLAHRLGVNAALIKLNQAGTVTNAFQAMTEAKEHGMATVVSARSGDTEDSWLADVAVGWGAGQIKVGSTTRSERTGKWNRLLQLEAINPSDELPYAGTSMLAGYQHLRW